MTIKNNLYQPISILIDSKHSFSLAGKETKTIPLTEKSEHMKTLEKSGTIKITLEG